MDSPSATESAHSSSYRPRPPTSPSRFTRDSKPAPIKGGTAIHAYVAEAARSMKRASTFSRAPSRAGQGRASTARPSIGRSESGSSSKNTDRPVSGRPASGRAPPLLTPDASVTMVSQDDSREGPHRDAKHRSNDAAQSLSTLPPSSSLGF